MNSLVLFLNRFSNGKTLVGLLLLYALFPVVLFKNAGEKINALAGKEIGPIDLTFGFNPQRTLQMVEDYGEAARAYYKQVELSVDIAYPVVYALMFAVMLTLIYRRLLGRPVVYLNMLPFVAMLFDFLENITIVSMLTHYPEQSRAMANLCEIFKLIKFLLFGLILFLIIYGLIKLLLQSRVDPLKKTV
jgi:hypothetical protein